MIAMSTQDASRLDGFRVKVEKKGVEEWLIKLLRSDDFFFPCDKHAERQKNMFCLDCQASVCPQCISSNFHAVHKLLQIRRYMYKLVVNMQDMQKHFNCAKVQTYLTNGSKVVYLNAPIRTYLTTKVNNTAPAKSTYGVPCEFCNKTVQEPHRFCSIACKLSLNIDEEHDKTELHTTHRCQELNGFSENEAHGSTSELNQEQDSSYSDDVEVGFKDEKGDHDPCLTNTERLKRKRRVLKRKGVPRRSPSF